ncbi:hypothetical protein [Pseudotamlana carrageenivorans]|uniref:Uncharacterized protein n=1 Tax=Pseudotamlana carrageenivorans TaxID=2069432 RepID=A0A2I7SF21_9FLAO|nr:hypothetical protein [Tamlana carrageenivorans]AUS04506.1 hypothetical protein C1A40_03015 [Tamlana carrageenivorans]
MSFEKAIHTDALKQYKPSGIRKRFLVSEGDLFQLYKEITLIRAKEDRERLMADFKALLKEAQAVTLTVKEQEGGHNGLCK